LVPRVMRPYLLGLGAISNLVGSSALRALPTGTQAGALKLAPVMELLMDFYNEWPLGQLRVNFSCRRVSRESLSLASLSPPWWGHRR
jgi:hypothetical protein